METTRRLALLALSIVVTAAIVVAMLIDSLVAVSGATSAPAGPKCEDAVHPVLHTLEFVDIDC